MTPVTADAPTAAATPERSVTAFAATPATAEPAPATAASARADALIAGSFDLLPAEPGKKRPPPDPDPANPAAPGPAIDTTASAPATPPVAPLPQRPPPAITTASAEPVKPIEMVPADPSLAAAVERLDARIGELRAASRTPVTGEAAPVPATKPASFATSETRVVGSAGVTVRSGPSKSNARLFALSSGQKVTVTGKKRGWLRVVDERGRSGWAYSSYLKGSKT